MLPILEEVDIIGEIGLDSVWCNTDMTLPVSYTHLGLRWIVNYARLRNEKTMEQRLAAEIMDAANGSGASVKKREEDVYKRQAYSRLTVKCVSGM